MSWHRLCITENTLSGTVYADWFGKFLQANDNKPFDELDTLLAPHKAQVVPGAVEVRDLYIEFKSEQDCLMFLLRWL